ncbi:MAG TPA: hypothetical protein VGM69_02395 [Chloroflexota bacterium]
MTAVRTPIGIRDRAPPPAHAGRRGRPTGRRRRPSCPRAARGDSPPAAGAAPGADLGGRGPGAEPDWPYLALLVLPWLFLGAPPLLVRLHACILCLPSLR